MPRWLLSVVGRDHRHRYGDVPCAPPGEFADGLDDGMGLAGAARVPIASRDGRAIAEPERSRRVCQLCAGWQLARWWLGLSRERSCAVAVAALGSLFLRMESSSESGHQGIPLRIGGSGLGAAC